MPSGAPFYFSHLRAPELDYDCIAPGMALHHGHLCVTARASHIEAVRKCSYKAAILHCSLCVVLTTSKLRPFLECLFKLDERSLKCAPRLKMMQLILHRSGCHMGSALSHVLLSTHVIILLLVPSWLLLYVGNCHNRWSLGVPCDDFHMCHPHQEHPLLLIPLGSESQAHPRRYAEPHYRSEPMPHLSWSQSQEN